MVWVKWALCIKIKNCLLLCNTLVTNTCCSVHLQNVCQSYLIILSYAFKMRQDYLSTSYLDQKYLPSERSERGRYELIQVTCAEIILSHFESIWWYFSHTFHYLTDEISWKYEKTCQSGTWMLVPPICVRLTFSPRTFTRITLAMCARPTLPT